jgi:hypothetical protein
MDAQKSKMITANQAGFLMHAFCFQNNKKSKHPNGFSQPATLVKNAVIRFRLTMQIGEPL